MTGWQSFVWHLMNDPIRSNPWSLGLTVILMMGSVTGLTVGLGGIYETWPDLRPRWRRETGVTETTRRHRRTPAADRTLEVPEVPAFPLPEAADFNLMLPARRSTPERVGRELAVVAGHPGVRSTCPQCDGHGTTMRPVRDLLAESLALAPDAAALLPVPPAGYGDRPSPPFPADVLVALAHLYDPDDRESLARLGATLAQVATRHREPASLDEYAQVKAQLLAAFEQALGARWRPEYGAAWGLAYDHAAVRLLAAQQDAALEGFAARHPEAVGVNPADRG